MENKDFEFGMNNIVLFIPESFGSSSDGLPSWLEGEIAKRFTVNVNGEERNYYEIWAQGSDDGVYEVDERWVFDSLDDLEEAVDAVLTTDIEKAEAIVDALQKEVQAAQDERQIARAELRSLKRRRVRWEQVCKKEREDG